MNMSPIPRAGECYYHFKQNPIQDDLNGRDLVSLKQKLLRTGSG